MSPSLEVELAAIADELDLLAVKREELFKRRVLLWQVAVGSLAATPVELARMSRVEPVTVRQLIRRQA